MESGYQGGLRTETEDPSSHLWEQTHSHFSDKFSGEQTGEQPNTESAGPFPTLFNGVSRLFQHWVPTAWKCVSHSLAGLSGQEVTKL